MANDLTIADITQGVGTALVDWSAGGVPVGTIIDGVSRLLFNDSPDVDSLVEHQEKTNENLEQLTEDMTTTNDNISELTTQVGDLTNQVQGLVSFQYFTFGTIFAFLFVGYMGKRIKRLFSWRKMKRGEGLM